MSSVEIRPLVAEDFERAIRAVATAFGDQAHPAQIEHWRNVVDVERSLAAYDGSEIVAASSTVKFALSVPGGEARTAGVTGVGVLPSHRRRGVLTGLMRRQLDDIRAHGEPLAALWASEALIYGRFGFGLATKNARIDADRDRAAPASRREPTGSVRLVGHDEALELLPPVYDRVRSVTPGFHSRTRAWWEHEVLADEEPYRRGASVLFRAVFERDGALEGYALYRVKQDWPDGLPGSTLIVNEEISATPLATRELWRFLFGVDLVAWLTTRTMSPDHPLFLLAAEPARLRFRLGDGLWLRLVDVRDALAARSYADRGSLVLDVEDDFCPWNVGCYELRAGEDGVAVTRAGREPDLRLGVGDLASAYLGGFSFAELLRAGRVDELRSGAVERADALFRTSRAPWCPEVF